MGRCPAQTSDARSDAKRHMRVLLSPLSSVFVDVCLSFCFTSKFFEITQSESNCDGERRRRERAGESEAENADFTRRIGPM